MTIFICEDDPYYQDMLYKCVKGLLSWESYDDIALACPTDDPAKLIGYIKEHKGSGLYFLDIELGGGYNGVEIAKEIRQYDPRGFIVFVTSHQKYMDLTFEYKIEALDYIQKEDAGTVQDKVYKCIENAYNKYVSRDEKSFYIFKATGNQWISCEHEDILFMRSDPDDARRIIVHTKKRQYTTYSSLDNLSKTLTSGSFFRCHRSYILNLRNIPLRDGAIIFSGDNKIIMHDGCECLVSVRKKRGLLELVNNMLK